MTTPRIAILISGQGRNLQAILDAVAAGKIPARIACVLSNRAEAPGLARARDAGVPVEVVPHTDYDNRVQFDLAVASALDRHQANFIAMAGFMRVLGDGFIRRFSGRMVNIHPSLLPRHRGLNTHRRVLEAGEQQHGASVHFVTSELDGGPVVIQGSFSVKPDDNEQSLAERALREVELKIYPQALAWIARGELSHTSAGLLFRNRKLSAPLSLTDLEPEFQ